MNAYFRSSILCALIFLAPIISFTQDYALDFHGTTDGRVTVPLDISPSAHPQLTISAWVNQTAVQSSRYATIASNDNGGYDRAIMVLNDGKYAIFAGRPIFTGLSVSLGTWEFISVTFSSTAVEMFRNGISVYSTTGESPSSGPANMVIGNAPIPGYTYPGKIDEVQIWNVIRTPAQILADQNTCFTGSESGLIGYFLLDNGPGSTTATDLAGGNTGVLSNLDPATDWVLGGVGCTSPALVPTLSQWGLILLSLLLLIGGTLAIRYKSVATTASIGRDSGAFYSPRNLPFNKSLYPKVLIGVAALLGLTFFISIQFFGYEMTSADVPGSLLSIPVAAYLVSLLME